STPKVASFDCRMSRTYTESSAPKQRTANIPAVMERMTNEMAEWVRMKRKPVPIDASTELAAVVCLGASRLMVSVITMPAEKKKLRLSNRKQELAPSSCTIAPETLGAMIWLP